MSKTQKYVSEETFRRAIENMQGRISGAYAGISRLNAAVAKLQSDTADQTPTSSLYSLTQRIAATQDIAAELATMDDKLARVGYRRGGPARSGLSDVRTALLRYL
jgi:hypothetical protein